MCAVSAAFRRTIFIGNARAAMVGIRTRHADWRNSDEAGMA